MIWVTGDKHGQLSAMELPDYKKIKKNDTLLILGKGHEDYQIIGHEKHHLDDKEIVLDYLKKQ